MCFYCTSVKRPQVHNVHNSNGEINTEPQSNLDIPKHVDNPMLNRNLQSGVLGFRYETKKETIVVYSSLKAKTFCILMSLSPMRK